MFFVKAYWMYNVRSNGNCKINDTFATVPFPRAATFSKELGGLPLIIYNGPQCGETTYSSDWPLVYSIYYDVGWGKGVLSAINGSSSEAFYAQMFARLIKENNMNVFTQDFLDFQSLLFPEWLQVRDVTTPTPLRTLMVVIYPSPQNQNHGMWGGGHPVHHGPLNRTLPSNVLLMSSIPITICITSHCSAGSCGRQASVASRTGCRGTGCPHPSPILHGSPSRHPGVCCLPSCDQRACIR